MCGGGDDGGLTDDAHDTLDAAAGVLHRHIVGASAAASPVIAGISGAQGSGKTTLAQAVAQSLRRAGLRTAVLSLDDFYLPLAARRALARAVHPLCAVRGVPGTHDIAALARTLDALATGDMAQGVTLPRFSKLDDDRLPAASWPTIRERPDAILLEGWCVGAAPLPAAALAAPANALEADEDPAGVWRSWWNGHLGGDYAAVWERLSLLALIVLPGIGSVVRSRLRQEQDIARAEGRPPCMDRADVARFVAHYQRLTEHIWAEMPARADIVLARDDSFRFEVLKPRGS